MRFLSVFVLALLGIASVVIALLVLERSTADAAICPVYKRDAEAMPPIHPGHNQHKRET